MNLKALVKKLLVIRAKGFIKTHRAHDTGIGKTMEDLLGIRENNLRLPDAGEIELKAKRIDSGSMLTVATKSPLPKGVNKILFEKYKYQDKEGKYSLHSTVCSSRKNRQGLRVAFTGEKLILKNPYNVKAYWPISIFDEVLKSKSNKILLIFAETRGERKTRAERFHYTEAYLLFGLNIKKFKNAIEKDSLKVDIRIGVYRSGKLKGRYHDHGTGFRIGKKDFLKIFDGYKKLM
ncbi:MAG: glycosyl hydrolase [Candidatus Lloydbacteria bacterium RIFCSPHIGHO2_02_FULL_50_13]|uniref:Glycosyl hydrolase n=1 Tax=Candidatus Lloydbacteria bacterium RIFCSPHIGHO2_02_FULL_50_13 TaxID=1798661 RepID=A0A1G2D4K4_9BACT|nr:MAG: glycosyl hydrolase [Candidatus Lloydbacteria bacterium RIFCSPHIGHO2_02_FULL_50_13]